MNDVIVSDGAGKDGCGSADGASSVAGDSTDVSDDSRSEMSGGSAYVSFFSSRAPVNMTYMSGPEFTCVRLFVRYVRIGLFWAVGRSLFLKRGAGRAGV